VDRRLPAVAEFDVPFYPGLRIGVPSLPGAVRALSDGGFEAIHVCSPGPAGVAGVLVARALGIPLVGSYHTELSAYAGLRSGDRGLADAAAMAVCAFYNACEVVLSPSPASDGALAAMGMAPERVLRWDRGPVEIGQRAREPRLHLVLAGGGPEQERLQERLGEAATFLGWLEGDELPRAYANADVFLFPSATDTFGQVILEAQASGLPVIAVAEGGPVSLIEDRVSGLLCDADAQDLGGAILDLAASPLLREHLSRGALRAVRLRTWERTLERLADGYRRAW
jgi:hypothetical protein